MSTDYYYAHYNNTNGEIIGLYTSAAPPVYQYPVPGNPTEINIDTSQLPTPWITITESQWLNIINSPGKYIINNDQVALTLTGEALAQRLIASNIKEIKTRRNLEMSQPITYKTMQFDTNEQSQFNIERSIRKWDSLTVLVNDRLGWILSNNSVYYVSLAELQELEDLITHRVELLYAYSGILEQQVTATQAIIDVTTQNWDVLARQDEILAILQGAA
ncbi:DUF4376 domain-containing protein [Piscirickettsia salmonis]|uniref:DUF4376 domain-containing protein n=1 Tax=Piscirickettsia salmonis TaxID=1238 RepID=A0A9Q6LPZ6_PISSA|nr:DUF4376 domain-containing protein [Piscirickettsia salmonis]APS59032.1 hypothetical protein AVI52_17495 [Piscirickettsia salmonis]QGN97061.1 hypothetical protein Psal006a_03716 [Piscirickettsia salmonis]QGO07861.1 hypothetical protein Psal009_03820 [Piscirickettsia salmonis]QGO36321.1 hypothetical protein Psal028_03708 [Piscirickettsia salmonis]QGO39946.1 hypothetical protein Psal040_03723 [Piscirickettsia salmonis]